MGLAAALAGALVGPMLLQSGSGAAALLAATYPDLQGRPRRLLEWQGRVLACNFWATWCIPCREEIPMLIGVRERYVGKGAEILGIGLDQRPRIEEFARRFGISYPVLVADASALELMRRLGNRSGGLPYTVFLDRRGLLAHRKLGKMHQAETEEILDRLLATKRTNFG